MLTSLTKSILSVALCLPIIVSLAAVAWAEPLSGTANGPPMDRSMAGLLYFAFAALVGFGVCCVWMTVYDLTFSPRQSAPSPVGKNVKTDR